MNSNVEVDSANNCLTCLHHGTSKIAASSATKGLWETSIVYLDVEQHDFCCCHKRYKRRNVAICLLSMSNGMNLKKVVQMILMLCCDAT